MKQRKKLQHLDLFSGIGGFSLGLESAGLAKTVAFCDIDNFCQEVLKKHWPEVPIFSNVKELTYEKLKTNGINKIDIITGGYPCQPFSVAGRKKGEEDPRHLWPEYFRLIKELRPTWVIGENVSGHIKLGLDTVLEDLESEGYTARAFSISATSIGANHKRERVWIIAHSNSQRLQGFGAKHELREGKTKVPFSWLRWWESEPRIRRVAHGIPQRVDRLKGLGNAVVPQIPFLLGLTIREMIENE